MNYSQLMLEDVEQNAQPGALVIRQNGQPGDFTEDGRGVAQSDPAVQRVVPSTPGDHAGGVPAPEDRDPEPYPGMAAGGGPLVRATASWCW